MKLYAIKKSGEFWNGSNFGAIQVAQVWADRGDMPSFIWDGDDRLEQEEFGDGGVAYYVDGLQDGDEEGEAVAWAVEV